MRSENKPEFTVDTGLFRQLGELLVGRDSTAIVELVKNAYDADATTIQVVGERLDEPGEGLILLADNGTGMTSDQFRSGFLRLAASGKTGGNRRSTVYQRRYTGEKGVGRLAAHKLAAALEITSVAAVTPAAASLAHETRTAHPRLGATSMLERLEGAERSVVSARIDWDEIEAVETLGDIEGGLSVVVSGAPTSTPLGTSLLLSRLRHTWVSDDVRDVVRQLQNFEPPSSLTKELPRSVLDAPLLFETPDVRDSKSGDPGLSIEFGGDLTQASEFWGSVVRTADWILEIRAKRGEDVHYALSPTKSGAASNHHATPLRASRPHPSPEVGPFFDARIALRPGKAPPAEVAWTEQNSGVRAYLEGFRILPYGEARNDWLSLDFNYTKRSGRLQLDPLLGGQVDGLEALRGLSTRDFSLRLLPNRAFFGAVFLHDENLGGLRTLVNREGFVPDSSYDCLVGLLSTGLNLLQRSWALASLRMKEEAAAVAAAKRTEREAEQKDDDGADADDGGKPDGTTTDDDDSGDGAGAEDDGDDDNEETDGDAWAFAGDDRSPRGSAAVLRDSLARLRESLGLHPADSTVAEPPQLELQIDRANVELAVGNVEAAADKLIADTSLLRVLASIGSQLAAFTHELALLIPTAVEAERSLAPKHGTRWPSAVTHARQSMKDLRHALERQASYLFDAASTEGRRRRRRLPVRERVDAAFLAFRGAAALRSVELVNSVPKEVTTPPMFSAELQAVLTNLLSNAIKASAEPGHVEVSAEALPRGVRIVVQNDGIAVDPAESERWFTPYESTTTEVDVVLGQGMGLGLPISRDLIAEYGGSVRFVKPSAEYSTAIEVVVEE